MTYEEWLAKIDLLKNNSLNQEILTTMQNTPINPNINDNIVFRLEKLINERFELSVNKITNNLTDIFSDSNYLDLILLNFKKELIYINNLIKLKQIPIEKQKTLLAEMQTKSDKIYDILTREANSIDPTGIYSMTIKNNKVKWSE